jgi:hypothetical protein
MNEQRSLNSERVSTLLGLKSEKRRSVLLFMRRMH